MKSGGLRPGRLKGGGVRREVEKPAAGLVSDPVDLDDWFPQVRFAPN